MEVQSLRYWRIARGYGVRELARRAGIMHRTVIRLERGEPGQPATFRKLASVLGIEPLQIAEYRRLVGLNGDAEGAVPPASRGTCHGHEEGPVVR